MNIKEKRIEKGLSQKDIMKDVSLYSKIENGKALSTPKDSERFAELFGCAVPELFTESELSFFAGFQAVLNRLRAKTANYSPQKIKSFLAPFASRPKDIWGLCANATG